METTERILGGTSYYPDHWPQTDWERDMKNIKECGLDIVRFGEFSWNWYEPEEGRFDFSGYDIFMDLAEKIGLRVVLCTPTAAAPAWLLHQYPDVRLTDQYGRKNQHGRHMVCYNHPKARALATRAIVTLAERYKDHPALYGWQIDNEPTCGESADRNRLYDYHPETVKLFKQYMRDKYKDLDALNEAWQNNFWSRSYSDWDQIEPPQEHGIPGLWLDWMRFRDMDVTNLIRWQLALLRGVKPSFIIGTNIPECGYATVLYGQDYWQQCKGLDYVGTDLYVLNVDREKSKRDITFSCDIVRSAANAAGAEFWISETQGGPGRLPWSSTFVKGVFDEEFQALSVKGYIAHGAKKILFFLWRPAVGGYEFGSNGMTYFDGTPHEVTRCIPKILEEAQPEKDRLKERPVIYIHHSRDSLLLARAYDPDDRPWSTIVGWHYFVNDLGYRAEFIDDETLKTHPWKEGDICIMPYTTVMDDTLSSGIKNAVLKGVRLVAGFGTGFFNEFGTIEFSCPCKGLEQYIPVRVKSFQMLPSALTTTIGGVPLDVLIADIESKDEEVLMKDSSDKPLVVHRKGVYYFAFDFGSFYKNANQKDQAVIQDLFGGILHQEL